MNFRIFCISSKGCEFMDILQSCATQYAELCHYTYDCTIARKGTAFSLRFVFSPYEFRHLAGLHLLENDHLKKNSDRILKDILCGKITLSTLQQSANWISCRDKLLHRLEALSNLSLLMDQFLQIYQFSPEKLLRQIPPVHTKIQADCLIRFQALAETDITFFFTVQYKDALCGRSIFINNTQDYSARQTSFTLLQKSRTDSRTGETTLLYQRNSSPK